ncbi:hypothetical protein D355_02133 [Enterococcus faecium SD1C-2]|nr:hypothetical protein D355_02133 [Enterococcus faecium SD1C-2]EPI18798.1 hypothetical protein D353_02268 [Enterococcus faecium OC2A-1]
MSRILGSCLISFFLCVIILPSLKQEVFLAMKEESALSNFP